MNARDLPKLRAFMELGAKWPLRPALDDPKMRIVYSDEAGIGDETIEPVVVVAAVTIEADQQWTAIESVIKLILERFVPEEQREAFEFKGNRLFSQLSRGNNEAILRAFLSIIQTFQLPITWGAVNRAGMRADYASKEITCPIEMMQNLAFILAATQLEAVMQFLWPNERAIWIADESRARLPMKASLRQYQQAALLPDEPVTRLDHIIDTIYFGPSHESIGIQLADACNFFIKRHFMGDQSAERFFQMIHPLMAERDRVPLYSPKDD